MDVAGLACTECLALGFRCPAWAWDDEKGLLCIAHADGAVCKHGAGLRCHPVPPELQKNRPGSPQAPKLKEPEPVVVPVPEVKPEPKPEPKYEVFDPVKEKPMPTFDERECNCGCGETYIPTGAAQKYKRGHKPGLKPNSKPQLQPQDAPVKINLSGDVGPLIAILEKRRDELTVAIDCLKRLQAGTI